MKKEKVLLIVSAVLDVALIATAILSESVPLAIITGSFLIAGAIQQKELVAKTIIHSDKVVVNYPEVEK